jgi:hypothetical protein
MNGAMAAKQDRGVGTDKNRISGFIVIFADTF